MVLTMIGTGMLWVGWYGFNAGSAAAADTLAANAFVTTTIATAVGEEAETIEEVYEPFLIQEGYLKRTSRGREATEKAYKHLKVVPPTSKTTGLCD